jgi:hypothetical protein
MVTRQNVVTLGGSLGHVPQKLKKKKTSYKKLIYFELLVHFQDENLYLINCTFANGLTI